MYRNVMMKPLAIYNLIYANKKKKNNGDGGEKEPTGFCLLHVMLRGDLEKGQEGDGDFQLHHSLTH
jgi:hypothetical protein